MISNVWVSTAHAMAHVRVFPAQLGGTMAEWFWAVVCVAELVVTLQNAFENPLHHI